MGEKHTNLPTLSEKGFVDIDVPAHRNHCRDEHRFIKGTVRGCIESIFEPDTNYTLLSTVANPEAKEELKKFVGFRAKMEDSWKIEARDSKENYKKFDYHHMGFSNGLMDLYMYILKNVAEKELGGTSYSNFPIVRTDNVHDMDRNREMVSWPVIHIIKGEDRTKEFKNIVNEFNNDGIYEIIRERQAPQNYQMAEVDKLRELGILPLIIEPREWKADSNTLRNAVNFLVQFTHSYKFDNSGPFD